MLKFKRVRYKNLMSAGNAWIEIDLTQPLQLFVGKNGHGKSTIEEALSLCLFNKPFRKINKPQLVNSINKKDCVVEVEMELGTRQILVRRGIKPNLFEIIENEEKRDQNADGVEDQDYLEKKILGRTHKTFSQIDILASTNFKPFMQLEAAPRREIVEDVLDLQIFSKMNKQLKERVTLNNKSLERNQGEIDAIERTIHVQEEMVRKLEDNLDEQIEGIRTERVDCEASIIQYRDDYREVKKESDEATGGVDISNHKTLNDKYNELYSMRSLLSDKIDGLKREIAFYERNDNCPTCKQTISEDFKQAVITDRTTSHTELVDGLALLVGQLDRLKTKIDAIDDIRTQIGQFERRLSSIKASAEGEKGRIERLDRQIATLEEKKNAPKAEVEDLTKYKDELEQLHRDREVLLNKKALMAAAAIMLKDDGIKSKVIKQYIPVINQLIAKYLQILDLPVGFELDENFEETIKARFRDSFSYYSFSEGQKKRMDLAILFTWREIARRRSMTSSNLLVLDEVFDGSLDSEGTEQLHNIIKSVSDDSNVIIISHNPNMAEKFDTVMEFKLVKDFTQMGPKEH